MVEIDVVTYSESKSAGGLSMDLAVVVYGTNLVECFIIGVVSCSFQEAG
jgi:hypothetical protein